MSEADRDDAARCRTSAMSALDSGDTEKAVRLLSKAKRMNPADDSIDDLINKVQSGEYVPSAGTDDAPKRSSSSPSGRDPRSSEGMRQRSSAASSQPAPSASKGGAAREYTPEQLRDVKRILRTKDYYDILTIARNSTEDQVKKAYKKLALKLHPDKNKAPGAEEAFKKAAKAAQCLGDGEKKKLYDHYGDEEEKPTQDRHFTTPEDLKVFFGGSSHTGGHGHTSGGAGDDKGAQRADPIQTPYSAGILVLLGLGWAVFARKEPISRFSFTVSGAYQTERSTATLHVPYYVATDFEDQYSEGSRGLSDFEKQVEVHHVRNLHSDCEIQEKAMYKNVMKAWNRGEGSAEDLKKARSQPKPACKEIEKIKKGHANTYPPARQRGY